MQADKQHKKVDKYPHDSGASIKSENLCMDIV